MGGTRARQFQADGMHEMGFAQPYAAVEKKRIEAARGRLLGHTASTGVGEFIGLTDNETVERKARVERHGQLVPVAPERDTLCTGSARPLGGHCSRRCRHAGRGKRRVGQERRIGQAAC